MSRDSDIAKVIVVRPYARRQSWPTLNLRLPPLNERPTVRLDLAAYHERARHLDAAAEAHWRASQGDESPTCNAGDGWPCTADAGEPCAKCLADAEYQRMRRMADESRERARQNGGES